MLKNKRQVGFALRILILIFSTLIAVFSVIAIEQNQEIVKIAPDSFVRSVLLILGPSVGLISMNYIFGLRGGNFHNWKTEVYLILGYILCFTSFTLPYVFPLAKVAPKEYYFMTDEHGIYDITPNWTYSILMLASLWLFFRVYASIKRNKETIQLPLK